MLKDPHRNVELYKCLFKTISALQPFELNNAFLRAATHPELSLPLGKVLRCTALPLGVRVLERCACVYVCGHQCICVHECMW